MTGKIQSAEELDDPLFFILFWKEHCMRHTATSDGKVYVM